ncbi:MAG: glycosyl hydrolase family 8 [Ignavibacteriaceae bacterium]
MQYYFIKRNYSSGLIILSFFLLILVYGCTEEEKVAADTSAKYSNLFSELLGVNESDVKNRIDSVFNMYFHGDDSTQRLYYPAGDDMAYIEDVLHDDVRSEGVSYGMMIAVQMDKKEEFDRMWKWVKTYMQHKEGPAKNYFAWQLKTNGELIDSTSASDGEEWFVMSLFFASARWGDGEGIFNYRNEAQIILDAMISKDPENIADKFRFANPEERASFKEGTIVNMFNTTEKKVVFVPEIQAAYFTDPSYHTPHFYELWAMWADKNNQFWKDAADTSRAFLKRAAHPVTGLSPDYAHFDGTPYSPWGGGNDNFQYDAWRVAMNVAVDYVWFAKDNWAVEQSNRLLNFFYKEGIKTYGGLYTLDGEKLSDEHNTGLVAMNATAAIASTIENRKEFVQELWDLSAPSGTYRYYDGMLYMFAMLQVSGNFKIYDFEK